MDPFRYSESKDSKISIRPVSRQEGGTQAAAKESKVQLLAMASWAVEPQEHKCVVETSGMWSISVDGPESLFRRDHARMENSTNPYIAKNVIKMLRKIVRHLDL